MAAAPPQIFAERRRIARRIRALALQQRPDAARFLGELVAEDMLERLAFLRHQPARALVIGDPAGMVSGPLEAGGAEVVRADIAGPSAVALDQPFPFGGFDLIAVMGLLDTINDLPGALIHIRRALAPGGLALASFGGAGSLPALRSAIFAAEPDKPAARMHPLVDARAGAGLLQRAGWTDPVTDMREIPVSYRSLDRLLGDLREQGLGAVLASPTPPLTRAALARARAAFLDGADEHGRVTETYAILTLSGRSPAKPSPVR